MSEVRLFQSKCEQLAIVKERFWKLEITEGVVNKKTFDLEREEGERYTFIGEDRMNDLIKRELELYFKVPTVVINLQFALDVEAQTIAAEAKKAAVEAAKAAAVAARAPPSSAARRATVPINSSQITILSNQSQSQDTNGPELATLMGELTGRWPCSLPQCKGRKVDLHLCYRNPLSPEEPRNHFPIKSETLKFWAQRIILQSATVDKPDKGVWTMLKASGDGERVPRSREPAVASTPVALNPQHLHQQGPPQGWFQHGASPIYINLGGREDLFPSINQALPQPRPVPALPPSDVVNPPSSPNAYRRSNTPDRNWCRSSNG